MKFIVKIRFLMVVWLLLGYAFSTNSNIYGRPQAPLDEKVWKKNVDDTDYTENLKKMKTKEPKQRNFHFPEGLGQLLKLLVFVIVLGLLFFLIIKIMVENLKVTNARIKRKNINIEEIEENLPDVDLASLLAQALKDGNYKLCVRLQFLLVIQKLDSLNLITWKKDKTNGDYVFELIGKPIHKPFRNIVFAFEKIWYGDVSIDENQYTRIAAFFNQVNQKLQPGEKKK